MWLLRDRRVGKGLLDRIRIQFVGHKENFGKRNCEIIDSIEEITRSNKECHVLVALSYGGRDEIVDAVNAAIREGSGHISKKSIEQRLYAPDVPFPDMIVRTGGEYRLSNFLMWQSAYSELFFLDKFWPAIQAADIDRLRREYQARDRKFGT